MIRRKQRIAMRDLSQLSAEDAETAAKHRVDGHVLRKQTLPPRQRELLILRKSARIG